MSEIEHTDNAPQPPEKWTAVSESSHTPTGKLLRDGTFVYQLGPNGLNVFSLSVQHGGNHDYSADEDEREKIAEMIVKALPKYELHVRAVEALREADEELMDLFHALTDEKQQVYGPAHAMLIGKIAAVLADLEDE